jgi:hypothetical protein
VLEGESPLDSGAQLVKPHSIMNEITPILIVLVVWWALQLWILPSFGVST